MKQKMLKLLRIKITMIAILIVFCFIALQTPWLKHLFVKTLTERLAKITRSQVSYQSFEGLIPFNFDLYKVSFTQNNETWLTVDQIHLHKTLLKFVFWKNKGIDVTFIHPHLIQLPENTSTHEFTWPEIPFQNLHVQVQGHQIEINPSISKMPLPLFDAMTSLDLRKKGEIFKSQISLSSKALPQASLSLKVRGNKKTNRLFTLVEFSDPKRELSPFLLQKAIPGFEGILTAQGSPDALFSFFQPNERPSGLFRGSLQAKLYPFEEARSSIWGTFLGQEILELDSTFEYESSVGLHFDRIELYSPFLDLEGEGTLKRDYVLSDTVLQGNFKSLDFLSAWTHTPIEGFLALKTFIQGPYQSPSIDFQVNQGELNLFHIQAKEMQGKGHIYFENESILSSLQLESKINQQQAELSADLNAKPMGEYYFSNIHLNYGKNQIEAEHFKITKNVLVGKIDFNILELNLLSPFFKESLQGSCLGFVNLDFDLSRGFYEQKIDGQVDGSLLEWKDLKLENYFSKVKGKYTPGHWASFEGDFLFQNEVLNFREFQFQNVQFLTTSQKGHYPYKLEALGPFSIFSSGELKKEQEKTVLNLFSLRGQIDEKRYLLIRPTEITLDHNLLFFTPIEMKVGPGSIYVQIKESDELLASIKKFPLEMISPFTNKYPLNGYLYLEASLKNIYKNPKGLLEGSFSEFSLKNYHHMPPYEGQFAFTYKNEHLKGKLQFTGKNRDQGFLQANIPFIFDLHPFHIDYPLDKHSVIDLNYVGTFNPFFQMLLPTNHLVEGKVHMDLGLKGDLRHPNLQGSLSLEQGYYENLYLGLTLKNIKTFLRAKGTKVELEHFQADDALEGTVRAGGFFEANLNRHFPFHFDVKVDRGKILQFDFLDATVDGSMVFKGNIKRGKLIGKFDVLETNLTIPSNSGSSLPQLKVQYLYPQKQACLQIPEALKPSIPIEYNLQLKVKENAHLKGRGLNTTWEGELDILGTSEQPDFKGTLKNVEGSFVFAGKVLNIEEGNIRFDGDLAKNTTVNLRGTTQVYNARITATLQGPFLGPKLSFRSDPPYSETEILSLILFNQPVQKLTPFQAVALTHSLATLGGAYVGPDLIDQVRRGIGVDQLTFGSKVTESGGDYITIQVGKYITRNVLVTLNRPLEMGTSPFVITAHVRGGFQIQTYFDENEISKILIQWKLSY